MWFSAMVRLVSSIENVGHSTLIRSVFLFRADEWEPARERAIELGRNAETSYVHADGRAVTVRMMYVETLDLLGDEIADGREVYSEPVPVGDQHLGTVFHPESSRPTQSGA